MTLAFGIYTNTSIFLVAVRTPPITHISWLIASLLLALFGLLLDTTISMAPVGYVALPWAAAGLGLATSIMVTEVIYGRKTT